MSPTAISLFSGAGGLDYGFEAAGFETRVCVEIDDDACQSLKSNRSWNVLHADAVETRSREILASAGLRRGEADVLIGGPPCQPFSMSGYWARGRALRLEDPRAVTLGAFMRIWKETVPKTVVFENVPGFIHPKANDALDFVTRTISEINAEEGTVYEPRYRVLNAADFGVPQARRRFLLVASRDGQDFRFPDPTHHSEGSQTKSSSDTPVEQHRTAWDAIGDLADDMPAELAVTGKWARLLPSIPEGENYLVHTNRGSGLPLFGWRRRYWSFLLKLAKGRPAWTIQAEPGPATGPFHWRNRRLSVLELCRLQTIPDNLYFHGTDRSVRRQIGNAVPSLLAEVIAREIKTQLLGSEPPLGVPLLLPAVRPREPQPEPITPVPNDYLALLNTDDAHPGPGLGRSALVRAPV